MVTLTSADNALKSYYLGAITQQLNTEANPFLAKIKQSTADVWGKEVRRLAQYGVNGGVGAGTEEGALPAAGGNNYEQFVTTLKNLYGTVEISDKAVRASENNAGAFVNLLTAEMEGLIRSSSFNFGRMLFGDGSGTLCTVSAAASGTTITVDSVKNVIEGMTVDILTSAGSAVSGATGRRILSVDRDEKTITLSGAALRFSAFSPSTAEAVREESAESRLNKPNFSMRVHLAKNLRSFLAIYGAPFRPSARAAR